MTESRAATTSLGGAPASAGVKQCCARLYETELVSRLLGESFHPGGLVLTERLGELLELGPGRRVLDAASGTGASAIALARRFGCEVIGVDLSPQNVARASAEALRLDVADLVRFEVADAERLPLIDASVDAVICECAFCTFPAKGQAAAEFARVLRSGGRVGLSDITREGNQPDELADLLAWVACLADATTAQGYAEWLERAGFVEVAVEPHDEALATLVRDIGTRLLAADIMAGLGKLDLTGIDLPAANRLAKQARRAITERRLGYAVVTAKRP